MTFNSKKYNNIVEKAGVEGGLGHKYYEEYRKLDEKNPKDFKRMEELKKINQEYYKKFNF